MRSTRAGVREVIGLDLGEVESGGSGSSSCARSGLGALTASGGISDHHEGLKTAIAQVLSCPWQRCTVHFVRKTHPHCRRLQRGLVSAALREVFNAENHKQARERVTHVIERLAAVTPKVCQLLEDGEEDLLAFYASPRAPHQAAVDQPA